MKKRIIKKTPRRKKSKKKSYQKFITIVITIIVSIVLGIVIGAYFFTNKKEIPSKKEIKKPTIVKKNKKLITFEEKTKALQIEYAKNKDNNIYIEKKSKVEQPKFHYEEPDYGKVGDIQQHPILQPEIKIKEPSKLIEKKVNIPTPIAKEIKSYKPKLVIIIDDVTNKYQIKRILQIGYTVNMSFLPPTTGHPNSAVITHKLNNYMIHLPLQASHHFKYEEENTLHINDNNKKIENRIREVKKWYPKAKFINNHTGSKFTSNAIAMDKLMKVIKKYHFNFLDSRTTSHSVAAIYAKKYGVKMLSRNIFLDNKKDEKYIQNQLKKTIKIAKRYGSAIAIGHPYRITLKTLKESKKLLEGVDLVYINQL